MIRVALPTGDLRDPVAAALDDAGVGIGPFAAGSRALRFEMAGGAAVARVFREKDIPVQVALGNYDVGICSLTWIEELSQRFPNHRVVRLRDLGFGASALWLAAAGEHSEPSVRIVSEYANIADAIARRARLPRYRVFGVWGAAEAYPPEDADLALIAADDDEAVRSHGLRPLGEVLRSSAWLIANRESLASKDLSSVLKPLLGAAAAVNAPAAALRVPEIGLRARAHETKRERLRLALPDGHAKSHTIAALREAGISVPGYEEESIVRRLFVEGHDVDVKVIRPHDMPRHVAIGQFDLAITGRDWLFDHLVQFPSSPVEEVVDLRRSRYGLAAIVKDVRADSIGGAVAEWRQSAPGRAIRVASEYPNIADHFARERHLGRYSVIPINGASEGFVPDDADILIEGIDTGSSVKANNLTVLERFFESTNCVIANKRPPEGALRPVFDRLVERLRAGAAEPVAAGGGA
ncbi:MAG: ATP phosphoribosyltransferase [Dehalococcoidia bacterium]